MNLDDTIVAIATPTGRGGIGVVRLAGPEAVSIAKERLSSDRYEVIILDEINYAAKLNLISVQDILDVINAKPKRTTLILTGNYATQEIIDKADLVTEMMEIKHPYRSGNKAKKGIDY